MVALKATARELSAVTQFSATQAAQGMEFLGRAGFKTTDIISAMPGLLDLAAAGALELGRAADIASNVLSGFQLQAKESNRVSDILALTAASANTNVEQLGDAMSYVAPVAAAFSKSVEETSAALGILGNAGIQASSAGTGLRGILANLATVTPAGRRCIARNGAVSQGRQPANQVTNRDCRRTGECRPECGPGADDLRRSRRPGYPGADQPECGTEEAG